MDSVLTFLANMPFWAWFALAGLLLVGEIVTGTSFLLWPAISAAILGLITTVQLDGQWAMQWMLFAIFTVALGVFGRPYAERWINKGFSERPHLNELSARWVGRRGTASAAFVAGRGRIRLGDTEWQARVAEGTPSVDADASVEVVGTDGTIMIVAPVPKQT